MAKATTSNTTKAVQTMLRTIGKPITTPVTIGAGSPQSASDSTEEKL